MHHRNSHSRQQPNTAQVTAACKEHCAVTAVTAVPRTCSDLTSCSRPSVHSAPLATSRVRAASVVARILRMASTRPGVAMMVLRLSSLNARFQSEESAKRCAASLLWCRPNSTSARISTPLLAVINSCSGEGKESAHEQPNSVGEACTSARAGQLPLAAPLSQQRVPACTYSEHRASPVQAL